MTTALIPPTNCKINYYQFIFFILVFFFFYKQNIVYNLFSSRSNKDAMTYEDVSLLCDLFYLPFEHGSAGTQILHDFNWLKTHAHVVCNSRSTNGCAADVSDTTVKDPEVKLTFCLLINI